MSNGGTNPQTAHRMGLAAELAECRRRLDNAGIQPDPEDPYDVVSRLTVALASLAALRAENEDLKARLQLIGAFNLLRADAREREVIRRSEVDARYEALLAAAREIIASGIQHYDHEGRSMVSLTNDRWVFAELLAAVSDVLGEHEEAMRLRAAHPRPDGALGEAQLPTPQPADFWHFEPGMACRSCKAAGGVHWQEIDNEHSDYRLRCVKCGARWTVDGPDA